jgi:hypothetical protein
MDDGEQQKPQGWNPRFLAYCRAHGRSPAAMLAHDEELWPGGKMCGFMLWLREQWKNWADARGGMPGVLSKAHHADFDGWLDARPAAACQGGALP